MAGTVGMTIHTSSGKVFEDEYDYLLWQHEPKLVQNKSTTEPDIQFSPSEKRSEKDEEAWHRGQGNAPPEDYALTPEELWLKYNPEHGGMTPKQSLEMMPPERYKIPPGATEEDVKKLEEEADRIERENVWKLPEKEFLRRREEEKTMKERREMDNLRKYLRPLQPKRKKDLPLG